MYIIFGFRSILSTWQHNTSILPSNLYISSSTKARSLMVRWHVNTTTTRNHGNRGADIPKVLSIFKYFLTP